PTAGGGAPSDPVRKAGASRAGVSAVAVPGMTSAPGSGAHARSGTEVSRRGCGVAVITSLFLPRAGRPSLLPGRCGVGPARQVPLTRQQGRNLNATQTPPGG